MLAGASSVGASINAPPAFSSFSNRGRLTLSPPRWMAKLGASGPPAPPPGKAFPPNPEEES